VQTISRLNIWVPGTVSRRELKIHSFQQIFAEGGRALSVATWRIFLHRRTDFCVFRAVCYHIVRTKVRKMSLQKSLSTEIDLQDDSDKEQELF